MTGLLFSLFLSYIFFPPPFLPFFFNPQQTAILSGYFFFLVISRQAVLGISFLSRYVCCLKFLSRLTSFPLLIFYLAISTAFSTFLFFFLAIFFRLNLLFLCGLLSFYPELFVLFLMFLPYITGIVIPIQIPVFSFAKFFSYIPL